jgi:G:T-mismatch repair DNA endonuclease (very short patch repair protein)
MPRGVYKKSEEHKRNLSKSLTGRTLSKEHCKNISLGNTGKKLTDETIQKMVKSHQGLHPTEESIKNMSGAHKGKTFTEEHCKNLSKSHIGKSKSGKTIKKMIEAAKKNWQKKEYKEKQIKAVFKGCNIKPNKLEMFLDKLLQELFSNQYKYVGDGKKIIAGKCPDFINVNGQKKIIELFGDYWHSKKVTGRTKIKEEKFRINHFAKHGGYQTLIVWEHELNNINKLKIKLRKFQEN